MADCGHGWNNKADCDLCTLERVAPQAVAQIAALQTTILALEQALWIALAGREVVVRDDTPSALEWRDLGDGGQLVRRAKS